MNTALVLFAAAENPALAIEFNVAPAAIIGLLVSTVLPILVGLVTTRVTDGRIKAILLAALAAVIGLGTELLASIQTGTTYDLGQGLLLALTSFLVAVAMHFGLWKPTGVAGAAQNVLVTAKGDVGVYRADTSGR